MKQILIFALLISSSLIFAQIGINTETPKATLDVKAKKEILSVDGIIPPRLTLEELTAKGDNLYGPEQDGAIIYITDSTGGNTLGQRAYITSKGLYLFDAYFQSLTEGRWVCLCCVPDVATKIAHKPK